jgi:hypothetical protein
MARTLASLRSLTATKLLAGLLATGLPAAAALALDESPRAYPTETDARIRAEQNALNRDQADLDAARRRLDDVAAAREKQLRELDDARGVAVSTSPDRIKADLERARQDRAALQEQVKTIRQKLDAARANCDKLHDAALAKFEATAEFKSSFAEFDKCRQELKVPTDAVLDQLAQTREFQDCVIAARDAKEKEQKLRADKNANPKDVKEAEDDFIAADNKVQAMEEKALIADAKVVALRKKVDDAQAVVRQMRDKFERDLLTDASFSPAVEELREQQGALDAAAADQKKLDEQIARLEAAEKSPVAAGADPAPSIDPREAQARLDQINADLVRARADVAKFEARVREDEDALAAARGDRPGAVASANDAFRDSDPIEPSSPPPPAVVEERTTGYEEAPLYDAPPVFLAPPICPAPLFVPCYTPPICAAPCYGGSGLFFSLGFSWSDHHHYYGYGDWHSHGHYDYGYHHSSYGYGGGHGYYSGGHGYNGGHGYYSGSHGYYNGSHGYYNGTSRYSDSGGSSSWSHGSTGNTGHSAYSSRYAYGSATHNYGNYRADSGRRSDSTYSHGTGGAYDGRTRARESYSPPSNSYRSGSSGTRYSDRRASAFDNRGGSTSSHHESSHVYASRPSYDLGRSDLGRSDSSGARTGGHNFSLAPDVSSRYRSSDHSSAHRSSSSYGSAFGGARTSDHNFSFSPMRDSSSHRSSDHSSAHSSSYSPSFHGGVSSGGSSHHHESNGGGGSSHGSHSSSSSSSSSHSHHH